VRRQERHKVKRMKEDEKDGNGGEERDRERKKMEE